MTIPCASRFALRDTPPPEGALPWKSPARPGPWAWLASLLTLAGLLLGCGSPTAAKPGKPLPAHTGGVAPVTYPHPIATVHQWALEALQSLGCTLRSETDSRLVGKFATGEIVTIALEETGANQTRVEVTSVRTFVGGAWQTDRRADTLWAINRVMRLTVAP